MRISDWSSDVCSSDLLLHWNGDTTNLPVKWHLSYLTDLYRDNLLVRPGALRIAGIPLDLTTIRTPARSEEHTSELQSLMRISYAVFCLKKKNKTDKHSNTNTATNKTNLKYISQLSYNI